MEHPTKRDAFLEAKKIISPHEHDQQKTRKVILENAAAIISVLVVGLSLVLYAYNGGYCKVFNLPVEVLPLEIDQYLPVAVQLVGVSVYILYYISLVKTERLLEKRRFSLLRIMYGYLIIGNIFTANHFDNIIGKWWSLAIYFGIPFLIELLLYRMKKPSKNKEVSDMEKRMLTEDFVFNRIFYSYYVQCGIFIVAIALIFAPLIGKTSAKANLNYQLCEIDNQLYAVIVDYDSTVLVQKAKEIKDKLVINNESYEYVQKEDLELVYCEYEKVIIQKGWSVRETTKEADNTIENVKKRITAFRWEEITVSPDWVMVIITAIYVVATCAICWANIKSAKATKEQVSESKRQYEETSRLENMPFLQIEHAKNTSVDYSISLWLNANDSIYSWSSHNLTFKNVGKGAAVNLIYTWKCRESQVRMTEVMPLNAVMAGDDYTFNCEFCYSTEMALPSKGILYLEYNDLLGRSYEQKMIFNFTFNDNNIILEEIETDIPKYCGILYDVFPKEEENS